MATTEIKVKTHVARDLLSSAAAFKNEAAAVWEYVANSLQYVTPGTPPIVQISVDLAAKLIRIGDNGRGMTREGLEHFFTMHAENLERQAGRPGRGKFGTGKSAAFGIGRYIEVETTSSGAKNVVRLDRAGIDKSSGSEIPVTWRIRDKSTDAPNGTVVTIGDIFIQKIRTNEIIEYIERNLQAYKARQPLVAVNDHVCEYRPPEIVASKTFYPSTAQAKVIGECALHIHVARVPLSETEQGVFVSAGVGNLVGVEDCGVGRKEFGNYLFGEVDVPTLEAPDSPIQPYDDSRSFKLNPEHPVVRVLVGFVGSKLEEVRQEQVRASREAHKTEQMRRLATEADKIAQILNDDFRQLRDRLDQIRAASSSKGPAKSLFGTQPEGAEQPEFWTAGTQERGNVEVPAPSRKVGGGTGRAPPEIAPTGEPDPRGRDAVDPAGGQGKTRRAKAGFEVSYERLGVAQQRSRYDGTRLAILINLDHPTVANALRASGSEDPIFRRLSYEIAFSEYAMALGYELAKRDPDMPPDDLLYEVRATLNRVARSAAALYL